MTKQRILIVNKFYYPRGGDCVCTINLEKLLKDRGHETAIYAMEYPENIESEWSGYFAKRVDFNGSPGSLLKAAARTLGMGDIKKSFRRILTDFKPDVVHLNNIHSYLSPVLARLAKESGAKVVWTLHDYKLLCPSYSCIRDGKPCELCFTNKREVIFKRCMKGSLAASIIGFAEAKMWNRKKLEQNVDTFICPSEFMKSKMVQGQFDSAKLVTLCNFIDPVKMESIMHRAGKTSVRDNRIYSYIGRLSPEKGIGHLLEVASTLPFRLVIAGTGPLEDELKNKYGNCPNISFTGRLNAIEVANLVSSSHATIIPSRWYENNPLGVIESLCAGTPVVGAEIGGIPELINRDNGITYAWDNPGDMEHAITQAMTREWDNDRIAMESQSRFSADTYYRSLISIYG